MNIEFSKRQKLFVKAREAGQKQIHKIVDTLHKEPVSGLLRQMGRVEVLIDSIRKLDVDGIWPPVVALDLRGLHTDTLRPLFLLGLRQEAADLLRDYLKVNTII